MRVVLAAVLLFVLPAALPAAEPTKEDYLRAVEKQLKEANGKVGPSVACVVVSKSDRYPKVEGQGEQPGKLGGYDLAAFLKANPGAHKLALSLDLSDPENIPNHGYACGVVIDAGLILTPYHVVEGARKVYVHLPGRAGSYADIHAADARHDLAVLRLIDPPPGMTPIKFADVTVSGPLEKQSNPPPGKLVILMANPYIPGGTPNRPRAALGSITDVRWPKEPGGQDALASYYAYGPLIEHAAKLDADISGAALLNLDGELMGLTTTMAAPGGERAPGYAFPADSHFRRVVETLRRGEEVEYGFLGVSVSVPNGLAVSPQPGGPAARARMAEGVITHVNGVRVHTYRELLWQVGSALAGSQIKLTVQHGNRVGNYRVTLAKHHHDQPTIASTRPEPVFGLRVDYARPSGIPAVAARELVPDSPAAAAFKKLGDDPKRWLITQVNGDDVISPAEFYKAAKGQQSVKLTVRDPSDGKSREVTLP